MVHFLALPVVSSTTATPRNAGAKVLSISSAVAMTYVSKTTVHLPSASLMPTTQDRRTVPFRAGATQHSRAEMTDSSTLKLQISLLS